MELSDLDRSSVEMVAAAYGVPVILDTDLQVVERSLQLDGQTINAAAPQWQLPFTRLNIAVGDEIWTIALGDHVQYVVTPTAVIVPATKIPSRLVREVFGF